MKREKYGCLLNLHEKKREKYGFKFYKKSKSLYKKREKYG